MTTLSQSIKDRLKTIPYLGSTLLWIKKRKLQLLNMIQFKEYKEGNLKWRLYAWYPNKKSGEALGSGQARTIFFHHEYSDILSMRSFLWISLMLMENHLI